MGPRKVSKASTDATGTTVASASFGHERCRMISLSDHDEGTSLSTLDKDFATPRCEEHSKAFGAPATRAPVMERTPEAERQREVANERMSQLAAKFVRASKKRSGWGSMTKTQSLPAKFLTMGRVRATSSDQPPQATVPEDEEEEEEEEDVAVMYFDWDDTLLPTWYLKSVVEPCTPGARGIPLSPDSPFYASLKQHAQLVEQTLRAARDLGNVALVTLSRRPWVHASAAQFLPGLDLQELLEELQIPIYYAGEHVQRSVARLAQTAEGIVSMLQQGVDILSRCKYKAMRKYLRKVSGKLSSTQNVLSIGDSETEEKALKDLLWHARGSCQSYCKTLRLQEDSNLKQLGDQLLVIIAWLPKMMAFREDFTLHFNNAGEATGFPGEDSFSEVWDDDDLEDGDNSSTVSGNSDQLLEEGSMSVYHSTEAAEP